MAKNQKQQRKRPAYEENDVPRTSNLNHHRDGKDAAQKPHTHTLLLTRRTPKTRKRVRVCLVEPPQTAIIYISPLLSFKKWLHNEITLNVNEKSSFLILSHSFKWRLYFCWVFWNIKLVKFNTKPATQVSRSESQVTRQLIRQLKTSLWIRAQFWEKG